jgi:hypothetical protein
MQVIQFLMENGERMGGLVNTALSAIRLVAKGNVSSAVWPKALSELPRVMAWCIRHRDERQNRVK